MTPDLPDPTARPGTDPDMTVIPPREPLPARADKEPPRPGQLPDDEFGNALPVGTRMGEFELLSVLGEGGFGIVYLAQDHSLHRQVALKEYMPSALAARTQAMTVSVRSRRHAETFEAGLRSFVNEARLLAQFDHPSLIKVYRFWEANGTAYMVMPYYVGRTLSATLAALPGPPDELWLRALLTPVLDALEVMHRANTFHRDIAPDNILILEDGRPVILDLGAARKVIGDMTQALTVILKTGYAPIEQYGEMPGVKQGPWTDLYALGSVVYYAITHQTPPQSVTRIVTDKYVPLAQTVAGHYGAGFLDAIDACLAVLPQHRPQNIAALRALLAAQPAPALTPPAPLPASDDEATVIRPAVTLPPVPTPAVPEPVAVPPPAPAPSPTPAPAPVPLPTPATRSGGSGRWIAAGAVLLVGAAGLAYTLSRPAAPPVVPVAPPPPPLVTTPAPPPAVTAAPAVVPIPVPPPASAIVQTPVTAPPPAAPAPAPVAAPPAPVAQKPALRPQRPADSPAPRPQPTDSARVTDPDEKPVLSPQGIPDKPAWSPTGQAPKVIKVQPPAPNYVTQVKCNDLLQKSALGDPMTDAERAFLKRECR